MFFSIGQPTMDHENVHTKTIMSARLGLVHVCLRFPCWKHETMLPRCFKIVLRQVLNFLHLTTASNYKHTLDILALINKLHSKDYIYFLHYNMWPNL